MIFIVQPASKLTAKTQLCYVRGGAQESVYMYANGKMESWDQTTTMHWRKVKRVPVTLAQVSASAFMKRFTVQRRKGLQPTWSCIECSHAQPPRNVGVSTFQAAYFHAQDAHLDDASWLEDFNAAHGPAIVSTRYVEHRPRDLKSTRAAVAKRRYREKLKQQQAAHVQSESV